MINLRFAACVQTSAVLKARWSEDELKSHRGSALTTEGRGNFSADTGGAMKRHVFREDEARVRGIVGGLVCKC